MKKVNIHIFKQMLILLPLLVLLFPAIRVQAEDKTYYPGYHEKNEYIKYGGENIFRNNYLYKSVIRGSKGGTMTIDLNNHRIILNNFKDYYDGDEYFYFTYYIKSHDTEIILIGNNEITKSDSSPSRFEIGGKESVITFRGPGTLTMNMPLISFNTLIFRDCEVNIHPKHNAALDIEDIEIYNSDINVSTESTGIYQNAYRLKKITMENSTFKAASKMDSYCVPWIVAEGNEYNYYLYNDFKEAFVPKSNEIIVDENGNTLYPVPCVFNNLKYFVFTKDKDTYNEKYWYNNVAWTVNILSPSRIERLKVVGQVEEKIAAIKTVTADSGDEIQVARNAYDNLDENIRYKVKNIDVLEKAEAAFKEINQKAANKVIDMISKLGTITSDSGEKIRDAENAYNNLTKEQKKLVSNFEDIEKAWTQFQKVQEQKEEEALKEGTWVFGERDFSNTFASNAGNTQGVVVKSARSKQKKTLTLKWQREKNCSGYQISYSRKKTFKSQKKILVKSGKKTSYTIKKLSSGKTYYIRIRSYRIVNSKKDYGKWSKVYRVKVK